MREEREKETRWGRPLTVAFGIKAEGTGPNVKGYVAPKVFLESLGG